MRIRGAPKSYDFSVHGSGDFSKFMLHLRKILLLWREDRFSGRGVGALKSCDAYSRSTKIIRFFCAWAERFFKINPLSSKNSFTSTRGCVFQPRVGAPKSCEAYSWSTYIVKYFCALWGRFGNIYTFRYSTNSLKKRCKSFEA